MRQRRSFSIRHPGIGMGVRRRAGVLGGEVPDGMRAGAPGRQEVDACALGNASLRTPGVEPGSQAWEACMMPLHYVHLYGLDMRGHNRGWVVSGLRFWWPAPGDNSVSRVRHLRTINEGLTYVGHRATSRKPLCARRESNLGHKHGRLV